MPTYKTNQTIRKQQHSYIFHKILLLFILKCLIFCFIEHLITSFFQKSNICSKEHMLPEDKEKENPDWVKFANWQLLVSDSDKIGDWSNLSWNTQFINSPNTNLPYISIVICWVHLFKVHSLYFMLCDFLH